jgi:hypothetical protein
MMSIQLHRYIENINKIHARIYSLLEEDHFILYYMEKERRDLGCHFAVNINSTSKFDK